ncbi:MAG: Ig-like domain-containing protein [Caloramator sp.]|nr:Ig-like domain-containing protein [Caloramator sp.]
MAKAKKVLSTVLVALFTVFTVLSYVPANAAKKAPAGPTKINLVAKPNAEYKVGDRVLVKFNASPYKGIVQYRAFLWKVGVGVVKELYPAYAKDSYFYKPVCVGTSTFTIDVFYATEPGTYEIVVGVKAKGAKASTAKYVNTGRFVVKAKEEANAEIKEFASLADVTVNEGQKVNLPETVKAKMSDGTEKEVAVKWDTVDTTKAGEYTVNGTVEGTTLKATVKVVVKAVALKVESVSAIAANKMLVKFNKAVDTAKATFEVKFGTITTNIKSVTWNDAKTEATLEGFVSFAAGEYTVNVKGFDSEVKGTVKYENRKVAKIEILGDYAILIGPGANAATVEFKVTDQYGQDATTALSSGLTTTTSANSYTISGTTITLNWSSSPAKDTPVVVSMVDPVTGTVGTKTLKVALPSAAGKIQLGALKNKDNKVLRTNTDLSTDIFAFDVNAVDQYGNPIKSATQLSNDYLVVTPAGITLQVQWVSATSTEPAKLKLVAVPTIAGTYTITVVSKATGDSAVASIVVEKAIALETFTLQTPSDLYILGEDLYIPFTAVDQYGNAITKYSQLYGNVTLSTTNTTKYPIQLEKNPIDGTARIKLSTGAGAAANDIVMVTAIANNKVSTITVKLNPAKVPTRIAGLSKDAVTKMTVGATSTLSNTDFVIKDQYERDMTSLPTGWTIDVVSSDTTKVNVAGLRLSGVAVGSSTITAKLNNNGTVVGTSAFEFVAETVSKSNIASYVIDTADKIYTTNTTYSAATLEEKAYAVDIEVYGKTANGDKVALKSTDLINLHSTNAKVDLTSASGKVYANGTFAPGVTEENATIVATINGADGITTVLKNVKLTKEVPVGSSIAVKAISGQYDVFKDNVAVITTTQAIAMNGKVVSAHARYNSTDDRASVYFEVKDQYGVACSAVKPVYYVLTAKDAAGKSLGESGYAGGAYSINNSGVLTVTSSVAGDEITITAITVDGKTATVKVIVK